MYQPKVKIFFNFIFNQNKMVSGKVNYYMKLSLSVNFISHKVPVNQVLVSKYLQGTK